jgi:hypothetical protein
MMKKISMVTNDHQNVTFHVGEKNNDQTFAYSFA